MSVIPKISLVTIKAEIEKCVPHGVRYGWSISNINEDAMNFQVKMKSLKDDELYFIEIKFDDYPEIPLYIDFIDPISGERNNKNAYPASNDSFFHPNACICTPCNRRAYSGYANLHCEWELKGWKSNPSIGSLINLEAILLAIFFRLTGDNYKGRMT